MSAEIVSLTDRLVPALLTGIYQGLLLTTAVWLCLKQCRTNAATRYAVWFVALCVVAGLPLAHLVLSAGSEETGADARANTLAAPEISQAFESASATPIPLGAREPEIDLVEFTGPPPVDLVFQKSSDEESHVSASVSMAGSIPSDAANPNDVPSPGDKGPFLRRLGVIAIPVQPMTGVIILGAVAALAAGRSLALVLQLLALRRMRRTAAPAPDWLWERFQAVAAEAGLRRRLALRVSAEAHSPMVAGFLPSVLLMPENLLSTPDPTRLTPVLRHEIAHAQRFDDWMNLVQQVIRTLFGFHPAVLWVSRRISIEREIACDDHVLHGGQKPRDYALFLTEFASRDRSRAWNAAPAAWSRKSQLTERVNMILKTNRSTSPRLGRVQMSLLGATMAASVALMLTVAPRVTMGNESSDLAPAKVGEEHTAAADLVADTPRGMLGAVNAEVAPAPEDTPVPTHRLPRSGPRLKEREESDATSSVEPAVAPVAHREGSVEQRLERVERMLEQLLRRPPAHTERKDPVAPTQPHPPKPVQLPRWSWETPPPPPAPIIPHEFEFDMHRRAAETHAKAQQEHAPAMLRQAEKHAADLEWKLRTEPLGANQRFERQRQELEKQRQTLEKQMALLEEQFQKLEREQEKIERERELLERMPEHQPGTKEKQTEKSDKVGEP